MTIKQITGLIILGVFVAAPNLYAQEQNINPSVYLGVDTNSNLQLNVNTIRNGQDTFIARQATPADGNKNTFFGPDGKTYIPAHAIEELRVLDLNKDGTITAAEMTNAKVDFVLARFLEGSNDIIPERPLEDEIVSIRLPTKPGDKAVINAGHENNLYIEEIKLP